MLARKVVAAARGVAHERPALETPEAHSLKAWPPSSASLPDIEHDEASIMTLVVRLRWLRRVVRCEARVC